MWYTWPSSPHPQTAKTSGSNHKGSTSVHKVDLPHPSAPSTWLPFLSVFAFARPDSQAQVCSTWQWQRRLYYPQWDRWLDTETAKVKQIGTETKETDGRSRRVAVWLLDSSVQVGWAVKVQQRWPHSWDWGGNSARTDFEPLKAFAIKGEK